MKSTRTVLLVVTVFLFFEARAVEVAPFVNAHLDRGDGSRVPVGPNGQAIEQIHLAAGNAIGAGVSIVDDAGTVEGELVLSYWSNSNARSCGKLPCQQDQQPSGPWSWTRWPLDAVVFHRWSRLKLGAGLTADLSQKLEGGGDASALNALDIKSRPGAILQADWRATKNVSVGLRYTMQEYRENASGAKLNGNALGLVFTLVFSKR